MIGLYRLLLYLYPASFRQEYGEEMCRIVARRLRGASVAGCVAVWIGAAADVVVNAARVQAEVTARDLRYGARALARTPGFTIVAILVSAIGIGATTAAFTLADHVLIRPFPFHQPERLVRLYQDQSSRGYSLMELSPPNYRDWKRMATGFQTMGAFTFSAGNLVGSGEPERLVGTRVTSEVLPMLGVRPLLGRLFTPDDDRDGAAGTLVLSYGLWQSRFAGDPGVIGRRVLLDDRPYEIVGVMPRSFSFPSRETRYWVTMRFTPQSFENRTDYHLYGIARLRDGVSMEQAREQLRAVAAELERQYPRENAHTSATVSDLRVDLSRQSRQLLIALLGASGCVLLIACTNLANLLLARSLTRRRELAVRAAMGAGRERLLRQMLTESLLLAAAGGALGIALAAAAMPLAVRLVPTALPIAGVPAVDLRVLIVALALTIATGVVFGVLVALRAGRVDTGALAEGARTGSSRHTERVRSALVVAEVTASVVLLVAAGLLIRALWTVQQVDPGFDAGGVITLRTALPMPRYASAERRGQFYRRVLTEARALPGVSDAGYISYVPLGPMRGGIWPITTDGREPDGTEEQTASLRFATPGFFATLRIPLLAGRDLDDRDTLETQRVAVVSQSFAERHWPGESPLGRRFFMAFTERVVVGVVGDIRIRGLERRSEPQVYLPYGQQPDEGLIGYSPKDLLVRTATAPESLVPALREIVARADPQQPISDVQLLETLVDGETAPRAVQLRVLGGFAAVALLLAGIGLHGLLAYGVSARSREIGVRIALGATARDILRLVVGQAAALACVGLLLGIVLAYSVGRTMQSLLAGISPSDATAFASATALVAVVTAAGTLLPARRALRTDPVTAIRVE